MRFIFVDHKRDAARAEDALTLSFGSELIGMQRDWNEELQSCREFPHTTPQERYYYLFAKRPALTTFFRFTICSCDQFLIKLYDAGFCVIGLSTK